MSNSKVKVAVRVRPRNEREEGLNSECVVRVSDNQITLLPPSSNKERERKEPHGFTFDNCFRTEDKHDPGQEDVFRHLGDGVLENIWLGYNVCIFAYGQTGSGKTFSMMGTDDQPGIVPRICSALFEKESSDSETFRIEASYLEIYNEEVRDLLRSAKKQKKLRVREDKLLGPYVEDLSCHAVQSYEEIKLLLDQGNQQRAIAETKMNEQSSRSHAILTLTVAQTCHDSKSGALRELVSKVSLVDLAGSERSHKSGAQGSQLKETSNINKSLSTLGLVINSLAEISENKRKSQYVNFRDSVLTWLLKNNLGGNSKTVMLATVSPAADNYQETLSTLRYADSAKRIVNQAVVNEDVKSKAIEELQQAIKRLREQLTTTEQEKEAKVQDLKSQLEEKENLLKDLKTSWEEKLKRTEIATQEWQKNLENMGVSLNTQDVVFSNDSYLIQQDKQLIIHNINATTKIGSGPSQDIQISGAEAEHCVIRKTEDGEVFLTPVDNCQTYVNSCLSKTMTQLWHEDKIQIGSKKFSLHLPNSPKPEYMKTNDSTEAEAQTYDDLNTEDDMLSLLSKRDSWNSSMIEDEKAKTDSAISTNYTTTEGFSQTISSSNDDFTSSKNKKISNISTQICNESYSYLINTNVNTARNTQSEYLGNVAGTQVQDSTVQCSPQYGEASSQTSERLKSSNCPKPEHMKTHDSTEAEAQTYDDLNTEDDELSILSTRDSWKSSMIEDEKAKIDSATKYMKTEGLIQTIPSSNDDFSASKNKKISHISNQICNESYSPFINMNVNTARNTQSEYLGIAAGTQVQDSTLQCSPQYGDVTFSNHCYPIHMIKATTKIGSGPSQDIQISGAEAEHCVIRKTEDGEAFLTPLDNSQTYVNSSKPEHMKTDDSTEAEAQTYDDLNTEDDKLSILPKRDSWKSSMIEDGKAKTDSAISTNYVTTEGLIQTIPSSNDDFSSSKNKKISHISTQICNESYSHFINMNVNTARNTQSEYLGIAAGAQVQDSTVQCYPQYGEASSQTSESLKSSNHIQNTSDLEYHATLPSDGGRRCSQGFFCWDKDTDLKWLTDLLPRTSISNASICCVSHPPGDYWKFDVQKFSPIILCHSFTKQVEWTQLEEFLTHCTGTCGKRVIVIMAKVMDGDLETVREDWRKWKFSGCDLIILTRQEIDSISTYRSALWRSVAEKIKNLKEILQTSTERIPVLWLWQTLQVKKAEVGIFSRSSESDYSWLVELLRSADFSDRVRSVTLCYISNNGFQRFRDVVSRCTFGILYHTKNRGRINMTDVTDSLYDEELQYLHDKLGKDNVIVVIDDVDDDSYREKCWILKNQPSIRALARDLFLFSHNDKMPKFDLQHKSNLKKKMALLKSMIC